MTALLFVLTFIAGVVVGVLALIGFVAFASAHAGHMFETATGVPDKIEPIDDEMAARIADRMHEEAIEA